jgi:hypothetical protein
MSKARKREYKHKSTKSINKEQNRILKNIEVINKIKSEL